MEHHNVKNKVNDGNEQDQKDPPHRFACNLQKDDEVINWYDLRPTGASRFLNRDPEGYDGKQAQKNVQYCCHGDFIIGLTGNKFNRFFYLFKQIRYARGIHSAGPVIIRGNHFRNKLNNVFLIF